MAETQEVLVPDVGDIEGVTIAEILVQPGDEVAADADLVVLESDKASMEVPSPAAGKVAEVKVAVGDEVSEGAVLLTLEVAAETAQSPPAPEEAEEAEEPEEPEEPEESDLSDESDESDRSDEAPHPKEPEKQEPPPAAPSLPPIDERAFSKAYAGPAVRRLARELGVDLGRVSGTGRKGRITKDDVRGFIKEALSSPSAGIGGFDWPQMPEIDFAKFGPVEPKPLSRIRKLSARNVHRSWLHVPHVTQHDDADITEMEAFRKAHGEEAKQRGFKLTPVAFLLKACAAALREFPDFNSSLGPEGENLILKGYVHIGVAVDTPNGLVVPVIRDVDRKGLYELAAELLETSGRARDGKLTPADFQGGCFTISSLGGIGGTAFTPIVNAPEVAILGVSRSRMTPVWRDGEFVPRLMLPLSLSYDHRVIDGAAAARFIVHLSALLGDLRRLLL